jgi:hypothetical protein
MFVDDHNPQAEYRSPRIGLHELAQHDISGGWGFTPLDPSSYYHAVAPGSQITPRGDSSERGKGHRMA